MGSAQPLDYNLTSDGVAYQDSHDDTHLRGIREARTGNPWYSLRFATKAISTRTQSAHPLNPTPTLRVHCPLSTALLLLSDQGS
jgi:hypothetical protein